MLRFGLSLLIYISVGRWLYSEVELYAPRLKPLLDSGLNYITIPRSDTWSRERFSAISRRFSNVFEHLTSDGVNSPNVSHAKGEELRDDRPKLELS